MSTSPLQNILNICTPEEQQWILDKVAPDAGWMTFPDYEDREQRFYRKQWELLRAIRDPKDTSVPNWLRQRFDQAQLSTLQEEVNSQRRVEADKAERRAAGERPLQRVQQVVKRLDLDVEQPQRGFRAWLRRLFRK